MNQVLKSVFLLLMIFFPVSGSALNVNLPSMTGLSYGQNISVPITTEDLTGGNVYSFLTKITYDPALFNCTGVTKSGTLSSSWSNPTTNNTIPGEITIASYGAFPLSGAGTLLYVNFNVIAQAGLSALNFDTFIYNEGTPSVTTQNGSLMIGTSVPLSVSFSSQNPGCFGYTDGSIDLTVSGGTVPISYIWSNGATTQDISNLGQGTFSVTVSDATSSIDTSITLTQPPAIILGIDIDTVICQGDSLLVDLGAGYSSYSWSSGSHSQSLTFYGAADVSAWVVNAAGCPSNDSAQIHLQLAPLPASAGTIAGPVNLCPGTTTASYSVPAVNSATSYAWTLPLGMSGSSTTNSIQINVTSGFTGGSISVAGINDCGPGTASSLAVGLFPQVVVNAGNDQTISQGGSAVLQAGATGGIGTFSYAWSNGAIGSSITVSPQITATYGVTVTDYNGCTASDAVIVNVTAASGPSVQIPSMNACQGNTVSVPVVVSNFQSIGSISLSLLFDTAVLSYSGYQYVHASLSSGLLVVNSNNNKIQLAWFSVNPIAIANDTLIEFIFTASLGTSALDWDLTTPGACYFTDANNNNILASYFNGNLTAANCSNLNGIVYYDNAAQTPLQNTNVILQGVGQPAIQQLSGLDGSFIYQNLNNNTYTLTAVPNKPWGGVNAVDALLVMRHFVGFDTLTGLREIAADVDASTFINAGDALMIARRFVSLIDSFPSGDWACESLPVVITGSGDVVQNVGCILFGDVDRSATFQSKQSKSVIKP